MTRCCCCAQVGSLFRGMASPLLGNAPLNALTFAGYGQAMRVMERLAGSPRPSRVGDRAFLDNPTTRSYIAGCWGGFLQCMVATPVEYVKCQAQAANHSISSVAIARRLLGNHPVPPLGIYRGWWITCIRDVPSYGVYFWGYETSKRTIARLASLPSAQTGTDYPTPVILAAGAVAGVLGWGVTYPAERIKTEIQTAPDTARPHDLRMWNVARRLWRAEGPAAFVNGLGPTLVRAIPVNAVTLLVYEWALAALQPPR